MSTTRHTLKAVPVLAALLAAVACGHDGAERAQLDLTPQKVRTETVGRVATTRQIEVRGIVQPAREAFVSSRVMGPVVAIRVEAGTAVTRGTALLEIQPEASEGQLAQAEGGLLQAEAALALSERNFKRFEALHGEGAASDLELDMARMEFERAQGAVKQAEGAVRAASSVADESVVRSPFTGRVVDTLVEVGDLAAPGRPLVRVESTGQRQIWLTVREADIDRVEVGSPIGVRIDSRPDLGTIKASVDEIVPSADPATHTFTVKAGLPALGLASGLSGRGQLVGDTTEIVVVPAQAIHRRGGLELVVIRADDGTARTRAVTTGRVLDDGRIEVLSGLQEGEMVAVDAPGPVADGTPLEVAR